MGILDFVKSDEKRASSVEDERVVSHQGEVGEVEEAGDDLHRGMKPRQLSTFPTNGTAGAEVLEPVTNLEPQIWQVEPLQDATPTAHYQGHEPRIPY